MLFSWCRSGPKRQGVVLQRTSSKTIMLTLGAVRHRVLLALYLVAKLCAGAVCAICAARGLGGCDGVVVVSPHVGPQYRKKHTSRGRTRASRRLL